jgi:hypothetical protein
MRTNSRSPEKHYSGYNIVFLNRRIILFAMYAVLIFGCRHKERRPILSFAALEKSPPFTATIDALQFVDTADVNLRSEQACLIGIQEQDGKKYFLGDGFGSETKQTLAFGHTLEIGKRYDFPKAWLDFKEKSSPTPTP